MSNYDNRMRNLLSLVSKIHEKGNRFIVEMLSKNGADGLAPSHGDILVCLYTKDRMTMKVLRFWLINSKNLGISREKLQRKIADIHIYY